MKALLGLETLETRDTPAAITLTGSTIQIDATDYSDQVQVSFDDRGSWWWPYDDQINVTLNNGVENLQSTFNAQSVSDIRFLGRGGNDYFNNSTNWRSTAYAGAGNDTLIGGSNADYLFGEDGNDVLLGNGGNDNVYGGEGHDWITGDAGNDYLSGDAGNDTLNGGAGGDLLTGGLGDDRLDGGRDGTRDTLYGDGGNDRFVQYHRRDWWGALTDEENLVDLGLGSDFVEHVYVN